MRAVNTAKYQLSYAFMASVAGKLDAIGKQYAFSGNLLDIALAGQYLGWAHSIRVSPAK